MEKEGQIKFPISTKDGVKLNQDSEKSSGETDLHLIHEVNHQDGDTGVKDKETFYFNPLEMWEVVEQVLLYLGPKELETCRDVCTLWRSEVERRKEALVDIRIGSRKGLNTVIQKLSRKSPKFEIRTLSFAKGDMASPNFSNLISFLTPALGTIVICYTCPVWIPALHQILKRCSNIFRLNVYTRKEMNATTSAPLFPILLLNGEGQTIGEHVLPALRILHYDSDLHPECTIRSALQTCPNLTEFVVVNMSRESRTALRSMDASSLRDVSIWNTRPHDDVPFNFEFLEQLRVLQMNLTSFSFELNHFNWTEFPDEAIEIFRAFLKAQAPTLEKLSLTNEEPDNLNPDPEMILSPFPIKFPSLTELRIDKIFMGNVAEVLEGAPALWKLDLVLENLGALKRVMKEECPLPIHENLGDFRVDCVRPGELSRFGQSFRNLKRLALSRIAKGLLQIVYRELSHLEIFVIEEDGNSYPLRNYEFTGIKGSVEKGRFGKPYIGDLKNLKELTLKLEWSPNMVTDEILTHGIFDIIENLDILSITGVEFSDESIEKLDSYMDRASSTSLEECAYDFVKKVPEPEEENYSE